MTEVEIAKFNNSSIRGTLVDGRILVGRLHETPQKGLYTVQPYPTRFGVVQGSFVEAIQANQFAKIEAYRV